MNKMSLIHKNLTVIHSRLFKNIFSSLNLRFISKPSLAKTEQIEFLKLYVNTKKSETNWLNFKNTVLDKQGNLNEKNVDAVILKVMVSNKNFNAAMSFASYLTSSKQELSLGAVNGLLNLYYEYNKKYDLSDNEKQFILDTYTNLYNKHKILDNVTAEKLIHALCCINEWQKCVRVLDDILVTSTPTHSAYSSLIGTLFKNNNKAEALKMIEKSIFDNRALQNYAYEQWIKYIFRNYKDKKYILKYLNELCSFISSSCAVVPKVTAKRLKEAFESIKWTVQLTEVRKQRGVCQSCSIKLDSLRLSLHEFTTLQQNVQNKLIVGSDLFLKTSPDELKRFTDFIHRAAPYDIVLDALNIAYAVGKGDVNHRIKMLSIVIKYFLEKKKRIFFLGRKHMLQWRKGSLLNLISETQSFFTEDISQDDPYLLTAAILSGPHTDIVSRDLFRGHRFLLQQEHLRQLFQRWQWEHQWMVFSNQYKPTIQAPLKFTPIAQQNNNGWHVPYENENMSTSGRINDGYPDISSWLCIRSKLT